jgi:CheY-like chemotaxis protein
MPVEYAYVDLEIPGTNGIELVRQLKQQQALHQPVLVALTGHAPEHHQMAVDAGLTHLLLKPVGLRELEVILEAVQTITDRRA